MGILARRPELPEELREAWQAFLDCAGAVESGRRILLGTLPTGRVAPAPIGVGTAALRRAAEDARGWMGRWELPELAAEWSACEQALERTDDACARVEHVAASTGELGDLLDAVQGAIVPLDAFSDAERAWRRRWRPPREPG